MLLNQNIINKIGLTDKEAVVYELLLEENETTAGKLIKKSGYKRATVYAVLESLIKKGMVEQTQLAPVIKYQAKHPYVLKEYAENKVRQIKSAEQELDALLPLLSNFYQQSHNQPGVKFYQGKEGVWKVMMDTLKSKTEILTPINYVFKLKKVNGFWKIVYREINLDKPLDLALTKKSN